jgi:TonB family protein
MAESASLQSFTPDTEPERRWSHWVFLVLLTLLVHFLFLLTRVDWNLPHAPPRVEVQQIDPQKLEEIRRHWREQEKSILMDKNQPRSATAPDHSRYMSDKNIRVEREQRARDHVILPKPGAPSQAQEQAREKPKSNAAARPQPKVEAKARNIPQLGNLGIPFHLADRPQSPQQAQEQSAPTPPGGEQYIDDKDLPTGSENMLNAEESVYYSFYARLYDAIGPVWASRLREVAPGARVQPGDYTTAVDVVLDREGNLVDVRILQSSNVREFDEAVNSSWKKIGKFPNPPSGLIKEDGYVHTGWNFTVQIGSSGGGLLLMPPERSY